jgi:hypothetical protein
MPNLYNTTQTTITSTGTFVTVFTASASTTLVKAVRIVHTGGASTATLAITKSGGTQTGMGEFSLTSKALTNTITEVLPLAAGDVLKVSVTHQPTHVWVSYVENAVSVAGQSIDVLVDVDTTGKANGNVLMWDSVAGQWEAAAPAAAGVASVSGTAPIASSGGATPDISIAAASASTAGSMSAADKTKLDGITAGAAVASVTGTAPIVSSGGTSPAISITAATTSADGSMSSADKTKLDGIAAGAEVNVNADWNAVSGDAQILNKPTIVSSVTGTAPISSSGGTTPDISIAAATTSAAGSMSASDKTKLDGITAGAAVASVTGTAPIVSSGGTTPAISITAATTSVAGSMSASDKTKLDGIAAGAEVNVNADWNSVSGDAQILNKPVIPSITQVTGKTVATGAWSLVSGIYEASISDAAITTTSIVDIIPDNGSAPTIRTAQLLPRTDSNSGSVKIYSTNAPAATITVTLNIYKQ